MKSKLNIKITLGRSGAKLVASNMVGFDANNYS